MMSHKGFSHLGLSTLDLDKTRDFYESMLGFKAVRCDIIKVKEGGQIRHIFFDTGRDQLIAFMEARGVPGVPATYDAGINRGLGVPSAFYHFAFEAGSEAGLEDKRNELVAKGVEVTDVVDHDWAKSIYFKDPERDPARVLLLHPQPQRRRRAHAGPLRDLQSAGSASRTRPRWLHVHRAAVQEPEPAARDPVDEPDADDAERQPGDEHADAEGEDDEQHAERHPQQAEPERADLPAEVRLEPRAAGVAPLHVVEDDGDDRGPAGEEGADHRGRRHDAHEQADRVQRVDRGASP